MRDVYILGAKGIGQYGGYESFLQGLIDNSSDVSFHIACKANGEGSMKLDQLKDIKDLGKDSFSYHGAECYLIIVKELGPAQAILYDLAAFEKFITEIKKNKIKEPIVYVLACRIGPFFNHFVKQIHRLGGKVYINPDGHEWKRAKWSKPIRRYWKISERLMVKYSDLVVCDSINIENYIKEEYERYHPKTTYISYGSDIKASVLKDNDEVFENWLKSKGLRKGKYYLSVGRFVPENNFETMIREFMDSNTDKDFALVTNVNDKFLNLLEDSLHYKQDPRVKFVGTVYDRELLKKIRENAFAYFHGHEVGGTNPSLLEALSSTEVNLLYDVGFNKEVAEDAALYWNKENGNLADLISKVERATQEEREDLGNKAKEVIKSRYSWKKICDEYYKIW